MPKVSYTNKSGKKKTKHFSYTKKGKAAARKLTKSKKGRMKSY
tara:strand:+ start:7415 stop:7543 length:129 start_codon:yes stop_codon:yes gene_type:complete